MPWRKVLIVFTLLIYAQPLTAQKFLVLEKMGSPKKRYQFYVGEKLEYQVKGERFFREDVITDLVDSVIVFDYGFYTFSKINAINIKGKKQVSFDPVRIGPYLIVAGIGLFLIDQFNNTIINGNKADIDKRLLRSSAIMAGAGGILMLLKRNKIKLKGNWRLRIVDI